MNAELESKFSASFDAYLTQDGQYVVNNYKFQKILGRGSYGEVVLAENLQTGDHVAIKCYSKQRLHKQRDVRGKPGAMRVKSGLDKVMEEIQALCLLPIHQNLVKFLEFLEDENGDAMYIVLELADGGVLMDVNMATGEYCPTRGDGEPFTEEEALLILRDVASGLAVCHSLGVAHRDIKPDNILITSEGRCQVADFSTCLIVESYPPRETEESKVKGESASGGYQPPTLTGKDKEGAAASPKPWYVQDVEGTYAFFAPEACQGRSHDPFQVDVWALGITAYVLLEGKTPWRSSLPHEVLEELSACTCTGIPLPSSWSKEYRDLVSGMLTIDPSKRPSINSVLDHGVFASLVEQEQQGPPPRLLRTKLNFDKLQPFAAPRIATFGLQTRSAAQARETLEDQLQGSLGEARGDVIRAPSPGSSSSVASTVRLKLWEGAGPMPSGLLYLETKTCCWSSWKAIHGELIGTSDQRGDQGGMMAIYETVPADGAGTRPDKSIPLSKISKLMTNEETLVFSFICCESLYRFKAHNFENYCRWVPRLKERATLGRHQPSVV